MHIGIHDYWKTRAGVFAVKDQDECWWPHCLWLSPKSAIILVHRSLVEGRKTKIQRHPFLVRQRSYNSDMVGVGSLEPPRTYALPWMIGSCHLMNGQHETTYMYNSCSEGSDWQTSHFNICLSCTVPSWLFNNHACQCASSQIMSIMSWKSTRPFSGTLKNMGRPGYEASPLYYDSLQQGTTCNWSMMK